MGLFRRHRPEAAGDAPGDDRADDRAAVERYEYLLRTAPPGTLEEVHAEAFEKLTPPQLDILFERLSDEQLVEHPPADSRPETLARAATRAEVARPGTLSRVFADDPGIDSRSLFPVSLLDTIAGYVIASTLVGAFFPYDYGTDADPSDADPSDADPSDADPSDADADADGYGDDAADAGFDGGGGFDF